MKDEVSLASNPIAMLWLAAGRMREKDCVN